MDPANLDALFAQCRSRISRHILRLVRNETDAEDLTQETFLRAYRSIETLKDDDAVGAWLYRIATHVCCDFLRHTARRPTSSEADGSPDSELASSDPGADRVFERLEMNECGEEFLDRLPENYRRVLLLHDLVGLSSREIARILKCTPGSVKIRLHRARNRFKAELEAGCDFYVNERGALVGARRTPRPR
jgi:RNA polymerase sigma-70 factor (ECF subfamily)